MRKNSANRSRAWLRTCASTSANSSCGTVESSQMLIVLPVAFQNRGSASIRAKLSTPMNVWSPIGFQSNSAM